MRFLNFIDNIFIKLIRQESDPLNKSRIRMIGYILVFYNVFSICLIIAYSLSDQPFHLIRVASIFIATLILGSIAIYTKYWRLISHLMLVIITLGVYSNLSIYIRAVNIETLQYIWFACALSFYMLGSKWGWFYSVINILPILAFTLADDKNYFFLGSGPHEISQPIYLFVTFFNFLLIVFLQYYFFKSFNRNLTKLKKTKSKLKELNKKLNKTLSEVESLSNSRIEFLSTMSHEIRTPLNGVIGLTNVLLIENPRKDQEENLDMLKFSAENLLLLVNNILDVNKLDSNNAELEKLSFNLVDLITRVYLSCKLIANEKTLDFKLYIDPVLNGKLVISDQTRLTQVLLNLLNNSIKFTEKGSVSISAHAIQLSENKIKVQFTIEDTGIGIKTAKQNIIFEPFKQASASINRNYGGTGLGLPIVKKILNMFDSDITLTSEENVGSKFVFDIVFDYKILEESKSTMTIDSNIDLSGLKVLVAEDNSINRLVIDRILKKWKISALIVEDGIQVLQSLESNDFDVILMDLHMPNMDGYEATLKIRGLDNSEKANIPIIALTASVNERVYHNVFDAKMNEYLSKPFNPDHLFTMLQGIANKKNS